MPPNRVAFFMASFFNKKTALFVTSFGFPITIGTNSPKANHYYRSRTYPLTKSIKKKQLPVC